jgi:ribosomal protein L16 Arg81 hydroxylase
MTEFTHTVAHLLEPIALETFLSRYYEREQLVIERGDPSHYAGLASLEALEDILYTTQPNSDELAVADDCHDIDSSEYLHADDSVDALRVQQLFNQGATISLRGLQRKVPSLAGLCRSAEQQFSCLFQANAYFTPAHAQGFKTHHDTHDVFVLQLVGSKEWRTYEPVIPLPLPGQRRYWDKPPQRTPTRTFTLRPGDLLYCPRGIPHDARAGPGTSIHVSLGALVTTWTEFLLEMVADVALRDPVFRTSLPPDYAIHELAPKELDRILRDLLARLQDQARPQYVLGLMAERFILNRPALIAGQRHSLQVAAALMLDSKVGCRPGLLYRLTQHRNKVTLICHSRQMVLPQFTAAAVKFALSNPSFLPRDLPGSLTDSAKIVLIKRLMREGMVVAATEVGC